MKTNMAYEDWAEGTIPAGTEYSILGGAGTGPSNTGSAATFLCVTPDGRYLNIPVHIVQGSAFSQRRIVRE